MGWFTTAMLSVYETLGVSPEIISDLEGDYWHGCWLTAGIQAVMVLVVVLIVRDIISNGDKNENAPAEDAAEARGGKGAS